MKVYAKLVDMIAEFRNDGSIRPYRFRIDLEDSSQEVIHVEKLINKGELIKDGSIKYLSFMCFIIAQGYRRLCEIRFDMNETKWYLWKI